MKRRNEGAQSQISSSSFFCFHSLVWTKGSLQLLITTIC
ncbi:hypothetical protein LINPERHAP1_LOCUS24442 [Linum perenne]